MKTETRFLAGPLQVQRPRFRQVTQFAIPG
jgi:hypothetical protein